MGNSAWGKGFHTGFAEGLKKGGIVGGVVGALVVGIPVAIVCNFDKVIGGISKFIKEPILKTWYYSGWEINEFSNKIVASKDDEVIECNVNEDIKKIIDNNEY